MKIVIRVDSGVEIGTGHVMRCLTLALALREQGHHILFISKPHTGNIIGLVREQGFVVAELDFNDSKDNSLAHSSWLGGGQVDDAQQSLKSVLQYFNSHVDLVVIDHYGIDIIWETIVRKHTTRLFVIDDLADRFHDCDYLLDQTFLRAPKDYSSLVPDDCALLLGTQFALLRQEFVLANSVIERKRQLCAERGGKKLLVIVGGTDHLNITAKILDVLVIDTISERITVVLGPTAPNYDSIKLRCKDDNRIVLLSGVSNVSELMLEHDICFGAAGTASWERCATGMPSILVAFAENQKTIINMLGEYGAASILSLEICTDSVLKRLAELRNSNHYHRMSNKCREVCDGQGTNRVIRRLIQ